MLRISLLVGQISVVLCCFGSADYDYYSYHPPPTAAPVKGTADSADPDFERNIDAAWGGHKKPEELQKKWQEWLKDYREEQERIENEPGDKYKKQRGPGSGWPYAWQGFGGGMGGAEAPPWAYVPINTGLPSFCYEPVRRGNCKEKMKRFAFNAFTQECVEFDYTGCGENQNNFVDKLKCIEHCMTMPVAGCNPETSILMESNENAIFQSGYIK